MEPRFRETVDGDLAQHEATTYVTNNLGETSVSSVQKYGVRKRKFIEDYRWDCYFTTLREGRLLPSYPCTISTVEEELIPGSVSATADFGGLHPYTFSGQSAHTFDKMLDLWVEPDQSLIDAASLAAASNAVSEGWDTLTFVAELRSTINTISTLGRALNRNSLQMASEAFRRSRGNPGKAWDLFRSYWLLGRYGVRPIVYDIEAAFKAAEKLISGIGQPFVLGKGYQTQSISEHATWVDSSPPYYVANGEHSLVGQWQIRSQAACLLDRPLAGVVSNDPLVTAWELIPYSFVIDRFINLGAWISTLAPTLGGSLELLSTSLKFEGTYTSHRVFGFAPGYGSGAIDNGTFVRKLRVYTRGPFNSVPLPPFHPRITPAFAVDLMALFVSGRNKVFAKLRGVRN